MSWNGARTNYTSLFNANRKRVHVRDMGCCVRCEIQFGITTKGNEVDHFKNSKQEGFSDEMSNLWLLCKPCHDEKTRREQKQKQGFTPRIDPMTGWPMDEPDWQEIISSRNQTRRF